MVDHTPGVLQFNGRPGQILFEEVQAQGPRGSADDRNAFDTIVFDTEETGHSVAPCVAQSWAMKRLATLHVNQKLKSRSTRPSSRSSPSRWLDSTHSSRSSKLASCPQLLPPLFIPVTLALDRRMLLSDRPSVTALRRLTAFRHERSSVKVLCTAF